MTNWNLLFRRTHLYLGLLLIPWMLIYALSTVTFNHGEFFRPYRTDPQLWRPLWEKDYALDVPAAGGPDVLRPIAARVLAEQGIKGPFGVQRQGRQLMINAPNFRQPLRFIYNLDAKKLRAEQRAFSVVELIGRLHTRTGYGHGSLLNDLWAFVVDLFCVATLAWIATGLYLWWKLPIPRGWGFVAIAGGVVTIAGLLVMV